MRLSGASLPDSTDSNVTICWGWADKSSQSLGSHISGWRRENLCCQWSHLQFLEDWITMGYLGNGDVSARVLWMCYVLFIAEFATFHLAEASRGSVAQRIWGRMCAKYPKSQSTIDWSKLLFVNIQFIRDWFIYNKRSTDPCLVFQINLLAWLIVSSCFHISVRKRLIECLLGERSRACV